MVSVFRDALPPIFPIHMPHCHNRETFDLNEQKRRTGVTFRTYPPSTIVIGSFSYNDGLTQQRWVPLEGLMDFPALLSSLVEVGLSGPVMFELDYHPVESKKSLEEVVMNLEWLLGGTFFHNIY